MQAWVNENLSKQLGSKLIGLILSDVLPLSVTDPYKFSKCWQCNHFSRDWRRQPNARLTDWWMQFGHRKKAITALTLSLLNLWLFSIYAFEPLKFHAHQRSHAGWVAESYQMLESILIGIVFIRCTYCLVCDCWTSSFNSKNSKRTLGSRIGSHPLDPSPEIPA